MHLSPNLNRIPTKLKHFLLRVNYQWSIRCSAGIDRGHLSFIQFSSFQKNQLHRRSQHLFSNLDHMESMYYFDKSSYRNLIMVSQEQGKTGSCLYFLVSCLLKLLENYLMVQLYQAWQMEDQLQHLKQLTQNYLVVKIQQNSPKLYYQKWLAYLSLEQIQIIIIKVRFILFPLT